MSRFRKLMIGAGMLSTSNVFAINGPNASAISNANWGTANDIFPYVGRLEIDQSNGDFNGDGDRFNDPHDSARREDRDTYCTATLIAPDVMVTAAHCFEDMGLAPGANIPAGRVRANFGNYGQILNAGGRIHPNVTYPVPSGSANDLAYVILNGTPNPAAISPVPLMPRAPRVGDVNLAVGFGVGDSSARGGAAIPPAPGFNIIQHNGGGPGRLAGAKGWTGITVDSVDATFARQSQDTDEDFTEGGDSGGPGMQHHLFPDRAWASNIVNTSRNDFVSTAVHGGHTPAVVGGAFVYDRDGATPGVQPGNDMWTRLDTQGNFLNQAIALGQVTIQHNLPVDPRSVPANTPVKVLIRAQVNSNEPYTMNIRLWEEDNQPVGLYDFYGNMELAPTDFGDDLAGIGFSSGVAGAAVREVCAWQELTAGDLVSYDEGGNPFDPDLDWNFQINYADSGRFSDLAPTDLAAINNGINQCSASIAAGTAIRGGFAMVPEPASLMLLAGGSLGLLIRRRR